MKQYTLRLNENHRNDYYDLSTLFKIEVPDDVSFDTVYKAVSNAQTIMNFYDSETEYEYTYGNKYGISKQDYDLFDELARNNRCNSLGRNNFYNMDILIEFAHVKHPDWNIQHFVEDMEIDLELD